MRIGTIEICFRRQKESMTIHLVNLTNPMHWKAPVRELYPVGPLEVRIRLPKNTKLRAARLLVSGTTVRPAMHENSATLTTPQIRDHDVIALDL